MHFSRSKGLDGINMSADLSGGELKRASSAGCNSWPQSGHASKPSISTHELHRRHRLLTGLLQADYSCTTGN